MKNLIFSFLFFILAAHYCMLYKLTQMMTSFYICVGFVSIALTLLIEELCHD